MAHASVALDAGTTSCRALVLDDAGAVLGTAQQEFAQHFPAPGHVEHDAREIATVQRSVMERAWAAAGEPRIAAVGLTNQRETVVLFDRATGEPVHRALVWQDRRTADALALMQRRGIEDPVRRRTGLTLDPYFSASKAAWLLENVPGARARAERGELGLATIDAWLLWTLTGGRTFATEPSNASRTCLYDLDLGDWSPELLEIFGIPRACLPEIRDSVGAFGEVEGRGWPILGVLGDQQAALFGHGAFAPGEAKCTYGTGAFVLQQCGDVDRPLPPDGVLATTAWRLGGRDAFALEGSVLVAGAAIQWLRDGLGILDDASSSEALARSVDDSGGVVFVPALAGLGTPHWDPDARGLLVGLHRGTERAHVVRAALESMALQVDDVLRAFAAAGKGVAELAVDGGAVANDLLLELQASVSGVGVVRPGSLETTAFGVYRAARLGRDGGRPEDTPGLPGAPTRFAPAGDPARWAQLRAAWGEAVRRAGGWDRVWRQPRP